MKERRLTARFTDARQIYAGFKRDGGVRLGAAMAYYSLFALAPTLVIAVAGAQRFLGSDKVIAELQGIMEGLFGSETAALFAEVLKLLVSTNYDSTLGAVGLVLFLWAVGVAYMQLQASFNVMWHVQVRPDMAILDTLKVQAPKLVLALLPASMLIVVSLASAFLSWVAERFQLGVMDTLVATLGSPLVAGIVMWLALLILYRIVPDARIRWRTVVLPSVLVAIAWSFGTYLYGLYLSEAGVQSAGGAAGAVFLLLVWMNYSARAVLLGVWWSRWLTERDGEVVPRPHAYLADASARA